MLRFAVAMLAMLAFSGATPVLARGRGSPPISRSGA